MKVRVTGDVDGKDKNRIDKEKIKIITRLHKIHPNLT